jgi:hypothetical protein
MGKKSRRTELTDRDLEILATIGRLRFASIDHIAALYFRSRITATARLRLLKESGYLVTLYVGVRPWSRTSTLVYALSARGSRAVAPSMGGVRPKHLAPSQKRSPLFLEHTLRRNDVHVCLDLLDRDQHAFQLLAWHQGRDQVGVDVFSGGIMRPRRRKRVRLQPDGVAIVRAQGELQALLFEVDLATVPPSRMRDRYAAYLDWWKIGLHRGRYADMPLRILTLAPDVVRTNRLRELARSISKEGDGRGLFWFAEQSVADLSEPVKLLAANWRTAETRKGKTQPRRLMRGL